MATSTIPNPLRPLGVARLLAGVWFIASGIGTLRQRSWLVPQAERLFNGDLGGTDAPIRSLLLLLIAVALLVIGVTVVVRGLRWLGGLPLPPGGPATLTPKEVVAALSRHELPGYGEGGLVPPWPMRRWLADDLSEMTSWRRDLMIGSVRAFGRSCGLVLALTALWFGVKFGVATDLLGPFPAGFVAVLPFATAVWAGLGLMLIGLDIPRSESVTLPRSASGAAGHDGRAEDFVESAPVLLNLKPSGPGVVLGFTGVLVQCLLLRWWNLSPISYPQLATSIIRHTGSIAGGVLFFALGHRMVAMASELLLAFRYDSVLVAFEPDSQGVIGRAATARTESQGLMGPRHVIAAAGGPVALENGLRLIQD